MQPSSSNNGPELGSILVFLMIAGFAVSLNIRVTDPLLPSLAAEFNSTPGKVAVVAIFYSIAHGIMQFGGGPLGDRFGKLRVLTILAFAAAATTAACALATSIFELSAFRLLSGATAAIMFPLAMAYIGDAVPYATRQATLARMLGAAMLGNMLGQAVSGIIADFLGWRAVFLHRRRHFYRWSFRPGVRAWSPQARRCARRQSGSLRRPDHTAPPPAATTSTPRARRDRGRRIPRDGDDDVPRGLSARRIRPVLFPDRPGVGRLRRGRRAVHDLRLLAHPATGRTSPRHVRRIAVFAVLRGGRVRAGMAGDTVLLFVAGATLLMLHNTLQVRASQMAPEARGASMSSFAASFFFGNLGGVAVGGPVYDHFGGAPMLVGAASLFAVVALVFRARLGTADKHG